MKNILMIFLLLICIKLSYGQENTCRLDNNYFLIGTLTDYMGREIYKEVENRVDTYYKYEKLLASTIDSLFEKDYPDLKLINNQKTGGFEIYSNSLAEKINEFYTYKPSGRMTYNGQIDLEELNLDSLTKTNDFYTSNFDTIFTGRLRTDIFKTDIQKLSFITGLYVRFGEPNDSTFCIRIHNSMSKAKICADLLKELNCSDVEYKVLSGYIPTSHIVYFTPTDELVNYLDTYTN